MSDYLRDIYTHPHLSIYQSYAVAPGQAIVMGDKVFLHPSDAQKLRIGLMNLNEEALNGPSPDTRSARRDGRKKPNIVARVAAAVIVGGLILWGVVSCGASLAQGARYSQCIEKAKSAGVTVDEFVETNCMKESR